MPFTKEKFDVIQEAWALGTAAYSGPKYFKVGEEGVTSLQVHNQGESLRVSFTVPSPHLGMQELKSGIGWMKRGGGAVKSQIYKEGDTVSISMNGDSFSLDFMEAARITIIKVRNRKRALRGIATRLSNLEEGLENFIDPKLSKGRDLVEEAFLDDSRSTFLKSLSRKRLQGA
jgi:hypothetical protein